MKCIRFDRIDGGARTWRTYRAVNTCDYMVDAKYYNCDAANCSDDGGLRLGRRQSQRPIDSYGVQPYVVRAFCVREIVR